MAVDFGIDFRLDSGYVTDPTNCTYWVAEAYPTTRTFTFVGASSITAGWSGSGNAIGRDRTGTPTADARITGCNRTNATTDTFRVDLPESGTYDVYLAAGDAQVTYECYFDILNSDASTVLYAQANTGTQSAGTWYDAQGTQHASSAAWVSSNAPRSLTFSGTAAYLRLNATVDISPICHLRFVKAGGGATPSIPPQQSTRIAPLLRF